MHDASDEETWRTITLPGATTTQLRTTKYLVPVDPDDTLEPLLINVSVHPLHSEFLRDAFPDEFSGLTPAVYQQQSLYPDRRFWSGVATTYLDHPGVGLTIWDDPADPTSTITEADARAVIDALSGRLPAEPVFVPGTSAQARSVAGWTQVPVHDPDGATDFEVYTAGAAYGTLRRIAVPDLQERITLGEVGYTDILVLDDTPAELLQPVAGTVTARRQAALSHLAVRAAGRGTPNCYLRDVWELAERWEGELVRMDCTETGLTFRAADRTEAEAWWAEQRPEPIEVVPPDLSVRELMPLGQLPLATADDRRRAVARYGSKGTWLAQLYGLVDEDLQYDGVLVPVSWYAEHIASLDTTDPDAARAAIEAAPVNPEHVQTLATTIVDIWGEDVAVRFRSSSNAEDALRFNGAGLYSSTWACPADDLDGDELGPSHCDPTKDEERTIVRALRRVWASTFNLAAHNEREWYGIDHEQVVMGVLINDRAPDEQASAVAFSGVPGTGDVRVMVNAQRGELSVVSPEPGVLPEVDLVDPEHAQVVRVAPSTEVDPGEWVLDEPTLLRMADVLRQIEGLAVDEPVPDGRLLWDTEWKVLADGRLIVKQVRPFLDVSSD